MTQENAQFTLSGILELLGFKFNPSRFVNNTAFRENCFFPLVRADLSNFDNLFSREIDGQEKFFGLKNFCNQALSRIDEQRAYHGEKIWVGRLASILSLIRRFLDGLSKDYLWQGLSVL